jgi:hypothetical protein
MNWRTGPGRRDQNLGRGGRGILQPWREGQNQDLKARIWTHRSGSGLVGPPEPEGRDLNFDAGTYIGKPGSGLGGRDLVLDSGTRTRRSAHELGELALGLGAGGLKRQ